jgi:hypothetical protein
MAASAGTIIPTGHLPVTGWTDVDLPVEKLWSIFTDVGRWPRWNTSIYWARMLYGPLRRGGTLVWAFNPIAPSYPYKLPAVAKIVELDVHELVEWEVRIAGLHARHRYMFERVDRTHCRFGSWEVGEGPLYRATRRFWDAHFRFVCECSLAGARLLGRS